MFSIHFKCKEKIPFVVLHGNASFKSGSNVHVYQESKQGFFHWHPVDMWVKVNFYRFKDGYYISKPDILQKLT